jgi:hypothetical protein
LEGWSCGIVKILSKNLLGGTEENPKIELKLIGVPAKIQTDYLSDASLES